MNAWKANIALVAFSALFGGELFAQVEEEIVTREIQYRAGNQELVGYLAQPRDSDSGPRPGIIVVHEWTGINDYARKRARDLAEAGYVAFALDMYGDGKEVAPSEARSMAGTVGSDFPLIRERFDAALEVLKSQEGVDTRRVGAIGYCFGGGIVLNMARLGTDLTGVVSFHGSLNTGLTATSGDIKTRILAFQGDGDPAAPEAVRDAFVREMEQSGAEYKYVVFPNLNAHNFTNPAGSTYHADEAGEAWKNMLEFFADIF